MRRKYYKLIVLEETKIYYDSFLRDVFFKNKIAKLHIKKSEYFWFSITFVFYRYFIKMLKHFYNDWYKHKMLYNSQNQIFLEPIFTYNRQYFAKRTFFYDFLKLNEFSGIPVFRNKIKKNFYKNNLFLITKYKNINNISNLLIPSDLNKTLFLLKTNIINDNLFEFFNVLELHFIFTIYLNIIAELYKFNILIVLKLNKKYI